MMVVMPSCTTKNWDCVEWREWEFMTRVSIHGLNPTETMVIEERGNVQTTVSPVQETRKSNRQPPSEQLNKTLDWVFMGTSHSHGRVILVMDLVAMLVKTLVVHQPVTPIEHKIEAQIPHSNLPNVRPPSRRRAIESQQRPPIAIGGIWLDFRIFDMIFLVLRPAPPTQELVCY